MSFKRIPETQKALKIQKSGSVSLKDDCFIPTPESDEVLVRVQCVGLNPFDWKSLDMSPSPGSTWGCDFAGNVVHSGSNVSRFEDGDAVAGLASGNNPDELAAGAFAEYVCVSEYLLFKMPPHMTFEEAATLPVGLVTVGMSLYYNLGLPLPYETRETDGQCVLVYGGGTATGTLAIQAIKLSGLTPITTCSPHGFERMKALGAAEAWDYHSPSCAGEIRSYTKDRLAYALDCITDSGSMKICYAAFGSAGGRYVGLDQFPIRGHTRRNVRPDWILALTVTGKPINWRKPYRRDAKPRDKEFAQRWAPMMQRLLDSGDIETHPMDVSDEGLEGVPRGADRIRKGLVGGRKLVYRIGQ